MFDLSQLAVCNRLLLLHAWSSIIIFKNLFTLSVTLLSYELGTIHNCTIICLRLRVGRWNLHVLGNYFLTSKNSSRYLLNTATLICFTQVQEFRVYIKHKTMNYSDVQLTHAMFVVLIMKLWFSVEEWGMVLFLWCVHFSQIGSLWF